jgi:D-alanyl-lipoteichoic acid acyltransferase DltB (MBOAT superfamily)
MLFNSFTYVLFLLPLVAAGQVLARKLLGRHGAALWLLASSLVFYGWSKPAHLPLLAGSILVNWGLGRLMSAAGENEARRGRLLRLGLVLNVGFLCLFKYLEFFAGVLFSLGVPRFPVPHLAFPLGISFFTLQQVMYLVDCYEGLVAPNDLADHATFVAFFPYVISGPLARAKSIVPQLGAPPASGAVPFDRAARGLFQFALGLGKKVLLADSFGRVVDLGYASAGQWSTLEAWAFSLAYTLQIYFDFSGYSDMALGSARLLGVEIPRNFDAPYRSRTVTEFWQRWHMSLSAFITTYLYTPILRSFKRATLATAAAATLLSMAIAGLWHGPAWTYVVFGLLHGSALVVNQYWKKRQSRNKSKRRLPAPVGWALTFGFVNLAFVFFRSPDLATAAHISLRLIPGPGALGTAVLGTVRTLGMTTLLPFLAAGAVVAFVGKSSDELARDFRPSWRSACSAAAIFVLSFLYMNSNFAKSFVYFAF